jgi:hypothetical protein
MENEIEAIRERHEAEIREPNKWTFNRAETAHADRATLLRALDAMAEENARLNEQRMAAAVRVALVSGDLDSYARGSLKAPSEERAAEMTKHLREALQLLARAALKEPGQ